MYWKPFMSVLRIHKKQNNFVILDKTCLNEVSISWGAKGLHAYLISLPDNWRVRISDLQKRATNGRDSVRALLNELELAGYIKKLMIRNEETGRFNGMEFLVVETPEQLIELKSPEPENPSSVGNEELLPVTENPLTGLPETENATLINNKLINNKLINIKTAASSQISSQSSFQEPEAAAVVSSQESSRSTNNFMSANQWSFNSGIRLTAHDALIAKSLTPNQQKLVDSFIRRLNYEEATRIKEEVIYCLMHPKHFTACGQDFSRKLNAIRKVILRGDWQTPAGMVKQSQNKSVSLRQTLEKTLQETRAEAVHFQRLQSSANPSIRNQFKAIVANVSCKIKQLEDEIHRLPIAQSMQATV